jgi:hypothetical protein
MPLSFKFFNYLFFTFIDGINYTSFTGVGIVIETNNNLNYRPDDILK